MIDNGSSNDDINDWGVPSAIFQTIGNWGILNYSVAFVFIAVLIYGFGLYFMAKKIDRFGFFLQVLG